MGVVATGLWPVRVGALSILVKRPAGPWLQRSIEHHVEAGDLMGANN
jgi:hypothetical protein